MLAMLWCASLPAQGYSPQEAVGKMTVADGLAVQLFAAEPDVRQPILVKVDNRGRLWTIQYLQYPNPAGLQRVKVDRWSRTVYDRVPKPPPHGPTGADLITILEDTDSDGRADKIKHFVTGLNLSTGLAFGHGGVYVLQVPYLLFYADNNRDDVPDGDPEVLLTGFGMEDAQSLANHLTWGPDGWLYGVNGSTTTCHIRGIEFQQGCWRYHPIRKEFELFCEGGGNTFGLTFDENGNLFYSTNGGPFVHAVQGGYFYKKFGKHGPLHNLYAYGYFGPLARDQVPGDPPTGGTIYLGDSFPAQFRGAFIAGNFLGHMASRWSIEPQGTTVRATYGGVLLNARDSWFGPTDMCLGPDGSMYVCDFHDQRTAHPDPDANWDRSNGRIYRIQATAAAPLQSLNLHQLSSEQLVQLLRHRNRWYADRARVLLAERRDQAVVPELEKMALQAENPLLALQALWALHVCAGLSDPVADKLLDHPYEYVRSWTVRLLGDTREVSAAISRRLTGLARTDDSAIVRSQLAATAKRLPAKDGLPIVEQILERNIDADDPRIPWLLWWAIEEKAITDAERVLSYFARTEAWDAAANHANLRRLVRRYAAEGTARCYAACARLLSAAPEPQQRSMLTALNQGLAERGSVGSELGHGGLYQPFAAVERQTPKKNPQSFATRVQPIVGELRRQIAEAWQSDQTDPLYLRLAMRADVDAAENHLRLLLANNETGEPSLVKLLDVSAELGRENLVPVVLNLIGEGQSEPVQLAALRVAARFQGEDIVDKLLACYADMPVALRSMSRDILLSRAASTRALLELVDHGRISAEEIPVDQLRQIALHDDEKLNAIVRKHWGNIGRGTPEEKLAEMRRLNNDLRPGGGDMSRGKELFLKHCGVCHRLFGEGNVIGPDLTNTSRKDTAYLLANAVDPSAVVRSNYLSFNVETTNGRILTGLIVDQDAASITLLDAKNGRTRIPRDQIAQMTESQVSLMPDNQLKSLQPQELRDLFRYLQKK